jgi:hypothetical protein
MDNGNVSTPSEPLLVPPAGETVGQAEHQDSRAATAQQPNLRPISVGVSREEHLQPQPSKSSDRQETISHQEPLVSDASKLHKHASYAHIVLDWWLWELAGAIVSILALASIVIVLLVYDGKSMPALPHDITVGLRLLAIAWQHIS